MSDFDTRIANPSGATLAFIGQIDEQKGRWIGGAELNPQVLDRLRRSVLVTSTGASTRIEGAKLSDEEIERIMRGLATQKLADRDTQEVRGYYDALGLVFDSWRDIELTENNIRHLHALMLRYSSKDERHKGSYKTIENRVDMKDASGKVIEVLFATTPPYLTPKQMEELVGWTRRALEARRYHPLLVIGNFIVEFLKIHPFLDGNGRLSRILTNLLLLRAGYAYVPYSSLERFIEERKTEYYIALRRSQVSFGTDQESIAPWSDFFFPVLLAQARKALSLLSAENINRLLSPNQRAVWEFLGTVGEATPREIALSSRVARRTVNQALERLMRLRRVERIGLGRATRYRRSAASEAEDSVTDVGYKS